MKAGGIASAIGFALALGTSGTAQEAFVRHTFSFLGTRLTIAAPGDVSGTLRLVRGTAGRVHVAARAVGGLAVASLAENGGDRLTLTAAGADRVEYVVVVPANAWVWVQLPGRPLAEVFGPLSDAAAYAWDRETAAPRSAAAMEAGGAAAATYTRERAPLLLYSAGVPPRSVAVSDPAGIRTLTVRIQGPRFRVQGSHPMALRRGAPDALVIQPPGPPMDLVITVPPHAVELTLHLGTAVALRIARGRATAFCSPLLQQTLEDGRVWFTFTPDRGRLTCQDPR